MGNLGPSSPSSGSSERWSRHPHRSHWLVIAAAGALFIVGVAVGAFGGLSNSTTHTTTVAKTQIKTVVPAEDFGGNGTVLVGTQVVPGTYRAPAPMYGTSCYWERLRNVPGGKGGHRHRLRENRPGSHQGRPERLRG